MLIAGLIGFVAGCVLTYIVFLLRLATIEAEIRCLQRHGVVKGYPPRAHDRG